MLSPLMIFTLHTAPTPFFVTFRHKRTGQALITRHLCHPQLQRSPLGWTAKLTPEGRYLAAALASLPDAVLNTLRRS